MTQGLGALVGGVKEGYDFSTKARRNRQLERAIDYELSDLDEKQKGRRGALDYYAAEQGLPAPEYANFQLEDPYLLRLVKKFGWGGGGVQGAPAQAIPTQTVPQPQVQVAGPQASGAQTFALPQEEAQQGYAFRDGGVVRMANGGSVGVSRIDELNAQQKAIEAQRVKDAAAAQRAANPSLTQRAVGGARSAVNKVGRAAAPLALGATAATTASTDTDDYRTRFAMPRERTALPPGAEVDETMEAQDPGLVGALTDSEFWGDVGNRSLGAASDLGNAMTLGLANNYYRDNEDVQPDVAAAAQALQIDKAPDVAAQPTTGAAAQAPVSAPAQAAQPQADAPFDWKSVNVMPEEMPSMSTRDWVDYRKNSVFNMMRQGMTEEQAHDSVTKMQQKGFMNSAQQASLYLQQGDAQSAARALKAAYQYFPNGSDVRFGITKDKAGQPALVAMGRDEESGESTGKPMLLNQERLAAMLNNFSNPAAFTAWTKDWRAEEFQQRKYEEVDKPAAQAAADTSRLNAQANLTRAQTAGRTGAGGGMRQSDYDKAYMFFSEQEELKALEDPQLAADLVDIMSRVYQANPGTPFTSVRKYVLAAHDNGTLDQELEILGLQ
jgi:hypothetical protein